MEEELEDEEIPSPLSDLLHALRHRPDVDMSPISILQFLNDSLAAILQPKRGHIHTAEPNDTENIGEHLHFVKPKAPR